MSVRGTEKAPSAGSSTGKEPSQKDPIKGTSFSTAIVSGIVAVVDGVIIASVGIVVYFGYVGWSPDSFSLYLMATTVNLIVTVLAFHFADLYRLEMITQPFNQIYKVVSICLLTFLLLLTMAFAVKVSGQFSRVWSFSSFFIETGLICGARIAFYFVILNWAKSGLLSRNVALVGGGEQGEKFIERVLTVDDPWLNIVGIFDDRLDRLPSEIGNYRMIGDLDELVTYAREQRLDDIVIALPWAASDRLKIIIEKLKVLPVNIRLSPDLIGMEYPILGYENIGSVQTLNIFAKPISNWDLVFKNIMDKVLIGAGVFFVAPLMLIVALAIKLDSRGPVLFRQKRYGMNNEEFDVFKYRTMYHGRPPETGVPQATRGDPRVTKLGNFLRRTSLDELPQLFNVLNGSMSLVGPRPHAVEHNKLYDEIISGYSARHRVKPGITGWAQVNGLRGETDTPDKMEARVKHDVYYIENWSVMLDFKILSKTALVLFGQESAY
jgi:Undecaprenyl-phosphate glucose phosphotransferase